MESKDLTVHSPDKNVYATVPREGALDQAVKYALEDLNQDPGAPGHDATTQVAFTTRPRAERSRGRIISRRADIMNKSVLSQLLDGAAFPAIMLAVAVSQIKVGPHRRETVSQGKRLTQELHTGDRVEQEAGRAQRH